MIGAISRQWTRISLLPSILAVHHSEGFPPEEASRRASRKIVAAIEIPIATTVIHTPSKTLG